MRKGIGTMRRFGQVAAAMGIWALSLTIGCGNFWVYPGSATGSGGGAGTGDYVYVASATNQMVAGFTVGTGTLTAIAGLPSALGFTPTAMAVNPANSMLFVSSSSGIYTYSIGSNGALNLESSGVTSGLSDVVSMAVSPDGQWLFALDGIATANQVMVQEFQINSSGALSTMTSGGATYTVTYAIMPPASPIAPPSPGAIGVATVGSGLDVFVALGTGGDLVIPFNTSTGAQSTQTAVQFPVPTGGSQYTSDNALAVSNSILYVVRANSTLAGALAAYSVGANSNGTPALSLVGQAATGLEPSAVVVNKAGTDVYVANKIDNTTGTISGFSIGNNGAPTALSPATFSSGLGSTPVALAVDNSKNYLLAISSGGKPDLTMYSYDSTTPGNLDFSTSGTTGTQPAGAVAIATTH